MASRVMHVLSLVFIILLLGHWNGCLQWFVPMLQHYPGDSWTALENLIDSEWTEQYTWAVFKALSHMLSIGFGRYPPQSTTDVWLTIISMLTGATCYALFVGQSTTIIQSFGISKRLYQEKFQQVEEYMSYMKLPRPLRRNITKYYEHRYRGKMFDETSILAEVNECLHEEIVNFNCRRLISSVSFFEKADQNFVTDLVAKLQSEVFLPGNVIVKEGTLGNKMFFLQEGMVSVLTKSGKCVAKLSDGSYFGEVCLLANTKRVASVKADTYCNVFTLSVEHFVSVLERYPHMRQVMENVAKARVDDCFFEKDDTILSDKTGDQNTATGDNNPVTSPSDGDDHKVGCFGLVRRTAKKRKHPKSE